MEGRDDGFGPAVGRRPLDLEHVVAELSAEHQGVGVGLGAPLLATALRDLQVRRLRNNNIHVHTHVHDEQPCACKYRSDISPVMSCTV